MEDLTAKLKEHTFCKDFTRDQVDVIASLSTWRDFQTNEVIFRTGDPSDKFFMVFSGHISIAVFLSDRGTTAIETIGEGDILGWSWFSPPYQWRFSAMALEETGAIAVNGKALREICEKDHALGYQILKKLILVYTQRLEMARSQILDLTKHEPFIK